MGAESFRFRLHSQASPAVPLPSLQLRERDLGQALACPKHGTPGTADLEPIFYEFGVDLYWAGHVHFYMT